MKTVKSISILALTAALTLSACGGDDGPDVSGVTVSSLESALAISPRTVSEADTSSALTALDIADVSGAFDWDDMSTSGGVTTFSKWRKDDGSIWADEIVFHGLNMDGGTAGFDKVEITGLAASMGTETAFGKLSAEYDSIILANPDVDGVSKLFQHIEDGKGIAAISGQGFGAGKCSGIRVLMGKGSEFMTVDSMVFGPGSTAGNLNMIMTGMSMDMDNMMSGSPTPMPPMNMTMSIANIKTMNVSKDYLEAMGDMMGGKMTPSQNMMSKMTYDAMVMENMVMDFDSARMVMPRMTAQGSKSGDVFTVKSVIEPSTLSFTAANPMTQMMGISEMPFSGEMTQTMDYANDKMSYKDAHVDFTDQFRIDFAMDTNGMLAFLEKTSEMDLQNPDEAAIMENMYDVDYLKFGFTDYAFMDKVWEVAAKQMGGGNAAMVKMQAKSGLAMATMAAETPEQAKMIEKMIGPLGDFLDEGGTLTFEMRPAPGFSLMDMENMSNPNDALDKLGLSLSHN